MERPSNFLVMHITESMQVFMSWEQKRGEQVENGSGSSSCPSVSVWSLLERVRYNARRRLIEASDGFDTMRKLKETNCP